MTRTRCIVVGSKPVEKIRTITHGLDESVGAPFSYDVAHHSIVGTKHRTGGRVTLATLRYRIGEDGPLYNPQIDQMEQFAEIIVTYLNNADAILRDRRNDQVVMQVVEDKTQEIKEQVKADLWADFPKMPFLEKVRIIWYILGGTPKVEGEGGPHEI